MLQATVARTEGLPRADSSCIVVCNEAHRFFVVEQLAAMELDARVILEPEGRNTAPAVALAAFSAMDDDPDCLLLIMPADHVIKDVPAFQAAVSKGIEAAENQRLVTFGILPTRPETGFGYIHASGDGDVLPVEAFVEKPDLATAESYLESGDYLWNSGMFLFKAGVYLKALESLAPDMFTHCRDAMVRQEQDGLFLRPDADAFARSPADSLDYAVMEKAENVSVVPMSCGWSDVGSWSALHEVLDADDDGNSLDGDVVAFGCRNSLISSESRLVGAIGLDNIVIVETKDSVLVADKSRSQDVKEIVNQLKLDERPETELHRQVFRLWGSYDSIENADNFQVKRLIVKPGAELSLQKHAHRAEHWVVVKGKARITRNDEVFDLGVNESTYIAIGDIHRITNPFDEPAHIIEVQCGDYLGEDDIVRIEDNYGRAGTNT